MERHARAPDPQATCAPAPGSEERAATELSCPPPLPDRKPAATVRCMKPQLVNWQAALIGCAFFGAAVVFALALVISVEFIAEVQQVEGKIGIEARATVFGNIFGALISGTLASAAVAYVFMAERKHERKKAIEELATLRRATLREFSQQMPENLSYIGTMFSDFNVAKPSETAREIVSFLDANLIKRPELSEANKNEFERRLHKEYAEYESFAFRFTFFENSARKAVEMATIDSNDTREVFQITWRMVFHARQFVASTRNIMLSMEDKELLPAISNCNSIVQASIALEEALRAKVFLPRAG
jgi:hypothetical protein